MIRHQLCITLVDDTILIFIIPFLVMLRRHMTGMYVINTTVHVEVRTSLPETIR